MKTKKYTYSQNKITPFLNPFFLVLLLMVLLLPLFILSVQEKQQTAVNAKYQLPTPTPNLILKK